MKLKYFVGYFQNGREKHSVSRNEREQLKAMKIEFKSNINLSRYNNKVDATELENYFSLCSKFLNFAGCNIFRKKTRQFRTIPMRL